MDRKKELKEKYKQMKPDIVLGDGSFHLKLKLKNLEQTNTRLYS